MEITIAQYRKAIKSTLSENLFKVLKTIMGLPNGKATPADLAAAMKTTVQAAHSKIGYIGKAIADNLGISADSFNKCGDDIPIHFQVIGNYFNRTGFAPVWIMNENLKKALKKLDTDEDGIGELAAFNIWKILTGAARNHRRINKNEIVQRLKSGHRVTHFALRRIREQCMIQNCPPLTILVENHSPLNPKDANLQDSFTEENFIKVCNFDWDLQKNPFDSSKRIFTDSEIINSLVANPEKSKEMFARIKIRGKAQPLFRKALMEVYESKCALCGFSVEYALEASHIVAWSASKSAEKLDIRNGILLCATHHKLFDSHLIRRNNDFSISVNYRTGMAPKHSECDKVMIQDLCNRKMILPRKKEHWPGLNILKSAIVN